MKYIVFKIDDIDRYLDEEEKVELAATQIAIETVRKMEGKKVNNYLVVNTDEPYADKVKALIEEHEGEKVSW